MASSEEMEVEADRPGCPDGHAADGQTMTMDSEQRSNVSDAEPGVQVWWCVPSAEVAAVAAEAQNLAEMKLRARRMRLVGLSAPRSSGVSPLMAKPSSAVLDVAEKALHSLDEERGDGSGGSNGIMHHDTKVGYLVADALGF